MLLGGGNPDKLYYCLNKFSENAFQKEMLYGFMIITEATYLIFMPISLN
jgi:hypothetical protein